MRVQQLPELIATRIAAGESIHRPASAVKELVENAIDAGAKKIKITTEQGGIQLISVEDDGNGIHAEDLRLAYSRHATSKITTDTDLYTLSTLGFRGEALSSMSAVARVSINSKQVDAEHAYLLRSEGGVIEEKASLTNRTTGTTIQVHDLFYNIPARRKFLRTPRTEAAKVMQVVQDLAMSHFDIHFILIMDSNEKYNFPPEEKEPLKRMEKILGKGFASHAHSIHHENNGLILTGWIANPSFNQSNAKLQHTFINGRYVKDLVMKQAVREGFKDVLFSGHHPAYVLYLDIPPQGVDVNVHPAKQEVRFRDHTMVRQFLIEAVNHTLNQLRPGQEMGVTQAAFTSRPQEPAPNTPPKNVNQDVNTVFSRIKPQPTQLVDFSSKGSNTPAVFSQETAVSLKPAEQPVLNTQIKETTTQTAEPEAKTRPRLGTVIGQLSQIYILAQSESGLVVVDMHAAHERILYEKLKKQYEVSNIPIQPLLIPQALTLSSMEMAAFEMQHDELLAAGIECDKLSEQTIAVRAAPSILKPATLEQCIRDILYDTHTEGQTQLKDHLHPILSTMACHSAIRAHQTLSKDQMQTVLDEMEDTPRSGLCNHGRPTTMFFTIKELDKLFLRGQ